AEKKNHVADKPEGCLSIFVGNLSWNIDEDTLRATFEHCGPIESVRLATDRETGDFRGFGHVDFGTSNSVPAAAEVASPVAVAADAAVDAADVVTLADAAVDVVVDAASVADVAADVETLADAAVDVAVDVASAADVAADADVVMAPPSASRRRSKTSKAKRRRLIKLLSQDQ
ncbi:hypothetical protein DYB28_010882, partial [Aphanomyces astaci]